MLSVNEESYGGIILIIAFVLIIQLLLCFKAKRTGIKLLPVLVFIALAVLLYICAILARDWGALFYLSPALLSFGLTVACGIGWLIWAIVRFIKRKR